MHYAARREIGKKCISVVCLLLLLSVVGCADSRMEPPLADSTMVEVMIDLHLAVAREEVTQQVPAGIRDSILTTHGADSAAYARTIWHYAQNPEKYEQIYGQVLDRLNSERIPLGPPDPTLTPDEPDLDAESQRVGRLPLR